MAWNPPPVTISTFSPYLTHLGYTVFIINPLLISQFAKLQLRKTKTDKKDAFVIEQFLSLNRESLTEGSVSSDIADLRDLSRQRESLVHQMNAVKHDMKRVLSGIRADYRDFQSIHASVDAELSLCICNKEGKA